MNGHLTDQQLIDYQFDLASQADASAIRTHLDKCDACRQRLHSLARKLAALELLRDDVKASRALLSDTIRNAKQAGRWRRILIYRMPWAGAVAATVIVGIALLLMPPGSGRQNALPPVPPQGGPLSEPASSKGMAGAEQLAAGADGGSAERLSASGGQPTPLLAATAHVPQTDAIAERPPFAPASAIELVVLPRREDVQLTIYNAADLTLVRERRNLTLKRGWNWLQFMWANTLIDPTSLHLEPLEHKGQIEVQQLVFPPRLRELGRWLIRSEIDGPASFELTYFTSGLAWRAFYMGTLSADEKTMHLEGYVRVQNHSGEDYEDAQTRLIVGQVHLLDHIAALARRQYAYGSPLPAARFGAEMGGMAGKGLDRDGSAPADSFAYYRVEEGLERKEVRKEGLSEYFLYTIEGTETIPNEWGKRLLSFEAEDIPVTSLYKYDDQRWGDQAVRFLSFANDEEHKLGETPIPDGTVRVYGLADEHGYLSYVGGTAVKYIPVGEEVELELGPARLVEVEPVLIETRSENYVFESDGDVAGWDEIETWEIKITNARNIPVDLEVTRGFETGSWELVLDNSALENQNGIEYKKHDVAHARFTTHVPEHTRRTIRYTVTRYQGTRSAYFAEREKERSR